jgi:hypothetical protein
MLFQLLSISDSTPFSFRSLNTPPDERRHAEPVRNPVNTVTMIIIVMSVCP